MKKRLALAAIAAVGMIFATITTTTPASAAPLDDGLTFIGKGIERVLVGVGCLGYKAQNYPAKACGTLPPAKPVAAPAPAPKAVPMKPPAKKAVVKKPKDKPAATPPVNKSELSFGPVFGAVLDYTYPVIATFPVIYGFQVQVATSMPPPIGGIGLRHLQ